MARDGVPKPFDLIWGSKVDTSNHLRTLAIRHTLKAFVASTRLGTIEHDQKVWFAIVAQNHFMPLNFRLLGLTVGEQILRHFQHNT